MTGTGRNQSEEKNQARTFGSGFSFHSSQQVLPIDTFGRARPYPLRNGRTQQRPVQSGSEQLILTSSFVRHARQFEQALPTPIPTQFASIASFPSWCGTGCSARLRRLQPGGESKRPFRQTPIAIEGRLFLQGHGVLRPICGMFGALFVAGVIPQPESHIVLPPTAEEIVKPTAAKASSGQMRGFAKAVFPEAGVKLDIA